MQQQDFTVTLLTDHTAHEAFNAINNVRGWWSEEVKGGTDKLHDEFDYHYKDVHSCRMRITELVPDKKVVWLVLDNYFNFIKDQSEWKGNTIHFDISPEGNQTRIRFTHQGLVPAYECYEICFNAWTGYLQNSLLQLITTGKGKPNPKES